MQLDQRAAVEIPLSGDPFAALPAPAGSLFQSNQPVTLNGARVAKQIGVSRAGSLDDADSAQKSDPAARSVNVPRTPISR